MRLSEIRRGWGKITEGTTIADRILLIALIVISVSGFIFIKKAFPHGTDVIIEVNGRPAYKLPLNTNTTISVRGIVGDTVVEIKDRKVRIKESPCPNKTCIHNGWIDKGAIICLPNRVVVNIGSPVGIDLQREDKKNKTIDATTG